MVRFAIFTLGIYLIIGCASSSRIHPSMATRPTLKSNCPRTEVPYFQENRCRGFNRSSLGKEGLWCCQDSAGKIILAAEFLKGKKHGRSEMFSKSENLESINYWNHGIQEGHQITFHENGQKELEYHLLEGQLHGSLKEYFPSGKLKSEGNYKKGSRHGRYQEWDESGQLVLEEKDIEGKNIESTYHLRIRNEVD